MEKRGWIQNKYMMKKFWGTYIMKVKVVLLIIFLIFHSLSDIAVKKRVLKNKFRRAQKVN